MASIDPVEFGSAEVPLSHAPSTTTTPRPHCQIHDGGTRERRRRRATRRPRDRTIVAQQRGPGCRQRRLWFWINLSHAFHGVNRKSARARRGPSIPDFPRCRRQCDQTIWTVDSGRHCTTHASTGPARQRWFRYFYRREPGPCWRRAHPSLDMQFTQTPLRSGYFYIASDMSISEGV